MSVPCAHPPLHAVVDAARVLLPRGARVLIAVSGGPDSQALLAHLAQLREVLGLDAVWAAGVDHKLRAAAGAELSVAQALAQRLDVPFYRLAVDVDHNGNLLARARRARYRGLRALAQTLGATHLATGHTATDQVETLLLHLCRGTSLKGAGAIRAQHRGVVRPLLGVGREAIEAWLAASGIAYAQDPSNTDARRARAQLRATVLPALRALNSRFEAHIGAFCDEAQTEDAWLARRAQRHLARLLHADQSLDAAGLAALRAIWRRRVLALWLARVGAKPTRRALAAVLHLIASWDANKGAGRQGVSVPGADIQLERDRLWRRSSPVRRAARDATPAAAPPKLEDVGVRVAVPGYTPLAGLGRLVATIHKVTADDPATGEMATGQNIPGQMGAAGAQAVAFDADRLHFEMTLRPWRQGDKVQPFGLRGRIKVGDLFTNHKVPRALRPGWPLLVCGDEILWVLGLRRSAHAPITATTRRIVTLKVEAQRIGAQDGLSPVSTGLF